MSLTIIEPHEHFEVLIQLAPALIKLEEPVTIVCSSASKREVLNVYPELASAISWITKKIPSEPKKDSVLLFTSLQYNRGRWLSWIKKFPTTIVVHNWNFYMGNPLRAWARPGETKYSFLQYSFEKNLRFHFKRSLSQKILSHTDILLPYSPLQTPFLKEHYPSAVMEWPIIYKKASNSIGAYDLIPIYGKVAHLDNYYIKQIQSNLHPHQICLCQPHEKKTLQKYFPHSEYIFTPLSHATYIDLFKKAGRVIFPFRQEMVFGVVREILGKTKYLARIYTALMYNKTVLMPPSIPFPPPLPPQSALDSALSNLIKYLRDTP